MTLLATLAFAAGALAAAGIVELAGVLVAGPRRRGTRRSLLAAVVRLGRRVGGPAPPADLGSRIAAAGVRAGLADVVALKAGGGLAGLLGALPAAALLPGRLGLVAPVAAAAGGFIAPDLWLRSRTRARSRRMAAELPDVLDLLRVALAAGLPTGRALHEIGRRHGGVLAGELRRAADRLSLGEPRDEVLDQLERRVPLAEAAALVAILRRADRYGAAPAEPLAALAAEARAARARAAQEAAARAAPQIQLVVALLLVPAVMLLVAAALAPALT